MMAWYDKLFVLSILLIALGGGGAIFAFAAMLRATRP